MGLLSNLSSRVFGSKSKSEIKDQEKKELLRRCYFEVMEQRRVLSADPVIAGVTYLEGDGGQDTAPDHFEVTFEGGAETTAMTQFTINGDQDQSGNLSIGDMFFDINDQQPGAGEHHEFAFDAANSVGVTAADIESFSVSENGLVLTVNLNNFEAGDIFAFTVDVDEVESLRPDKIASGVEFEGTFFNASFVDQHYTFEDRTVAVTQTVDGGFSQNQTEGIFYDEYNTLLAEGESITGTQIELTRDNQNGQANRTAAAIDAYDLTPKPITISGTVYHDENLNCEHDSDESGIGGVEIQLQKLNEATGQYETVATTLTDAAGNYEFGEDLGLNPGDYQLVEVQPDGFLDVGVEAGTHGGTKGENVISNISVPLGGSDATGYDFKEVKPASLSGNVWHDENNDGVFDPNEQGIANVLIQVTRVGAKTGVAEDPFADMDSVFVRTDANGHYSVDTLPPGIYEVVEINNYPAGEVDPLAAYIDGKDSTGNIDGTTVGSKSNDKFTQVELCAGDDGVEYNFGEIRPAQISGYVTLATPEGDCLDPSDPNHVGVGGVSIELYDVDGNLVGSTQTDADGSYEFDGLAPGVYTVVEIQPGSLLDGDEHVGEIDGTTSGALVDNDKFTVSLESGDQGTNYNFCEHDPAELKGTVWFDANDNGVQDSGEDGIAGVVIELFDKDGTKIAETVTDANGDYCFTDLYAGDYLVRQTQPDGYIDGQESLGDVDGVTRGEVGEDFFCVTLNGGESGQNYDFGEIRPASLKGTVWVDSNNDGVLDSGEDRIEGVVIQLFDKDGNVVSETVTDANGEYCFENLTPGDYLIKEIQPTDYLDGKESLGDVNGVESGELGEDFFCVTIEGGDQGTEYNFGEVPPAELCGTVYHDANNNGRQDSGEEGIGGVVIELLDKNGNLIAETVTDANGDYCFNDLYPGEYVVQETQPDGWIDGKESLGDVNGTVSGEVSQDSFCVHLEAGDEGNNYDFGELQPAEIHGRVWEDGPAIETEDGLVPDNYRELRDGIYQEGVDTPLAGVRMQLYYYFDPTNNSIVPRPVTLGEVQADHYDHMGTDDPNAPVWVETMENGEYWFTGLTPGSYIVLQSQPDGYLDSNDTEGTTSGFTFDSISEANTAPAAIISTFSTEQIMDSVVNIQLQSGGISELNNFSEVRVTATPTIDPPTVIPPAIPPTPQAPPSPTPPSAGITGFPGLFGAQPGSTLQFLGDNREANFKTQATPSQSPYTWHLSVVNGGLPRAIDEGGSGDIWQQAGYIGDSDWQRYDMNDAVWTFTETLDDKTIVKTSQGIQFGMLGGTPLAGDFDGDGTDEVAVFKDGYWMIDINRNGQWDEGDLLARLGDAQDRPVVGDWDGDGKDDIGIYGPMWERDPEAIERDPGLPNPDNDPYTKPKNVPPTDEDATNGARTMKLTSYGKQRADVVDHVFGIGDGEVIPVTGDWNGNGVRSIGTFTDGRWELDVNGDGRFDYEDETVDFGRAGDIPVVGDFNGDGIEDIAVYRSGTWMIDTNGNRELDATDKTFEMGGANSKPVVGDWDGDGTDEPGLYTEQRNAG